MLLVNVIDQCLQLDFEFKLPNPIDPEVIVRATTLSRSQTIGDYK